MSDGTILPSSDISSKPNSESGQQIEKMTSGPKNRVKRDGNAAVY